jgi:hypothetical protein
MLIRRLSNKFFSTLKRHKKKTKKNDKKVGSKEVKEWLKNNKLKRSTCDSTLPFPWESEV